MLGVGGRWSPPICSCLSTRSPRGHSSLILLLPREDGPALPSTGGWSSASSDEHDRAPRDVSSRRRGIHASSGCGIVEMASRGRVCRNCRFHVKPTASDRHQSGEASARGGQLGLDLSRYRSPLSALRSRLSEHAGCESSADACGGIKLPAHRSGDGHARFHVKRHPTVVRSREGRRHAPPRITGLRAPVTTTRRFT